ncbi:hypothetical protein ACQPWY_02655 [Pseudonocardia xinjiangensis]|uniref:hypothetical protein n=1 Tax=Pseudonocardia xinjiangensis TaxID=75289 RepID=UPI003D8E25AE
MDLPRRTRAAASAAALSAALVVGMAGTAFAYDHLDCGDFTYQEDAQAAFDAAPARSHPLDDARSGTSGDGVACEALPHRDSGAADPAVGDQIEDAVVAPTPVTTPQAAPGKLVTVADRAGGRWVPESGGVTTGGTPSP